MVRRLKTSLSTKCQIICKMEVLDMELLCFVTAVLVLLVTERGWIGFTWSVLIIHFERPSQLFIWCPTAGCHISGDHKLLATQYFYFTWNIYFTIFFSYFQFTLKSMNPFESLSKTLKIWSTKMEAFFLGIIIAYMSIIFDLYNLPSGQSAWKTLQKTYLYSLKRMQVFIV